MTPPLRPELLADVRPAFWHRIDVVDETGSTNADLAARAAAGEDIARTVLAAEHQTAGRGRHGRSWATPKGSQLAMSVGVPTDSVPADQWGWLPLLTGVAVAEAVRELTGVAARLKWPNDVMVGEQKLAGILAEVAGPVIIVGIGLNVALTADEAPVPTATSLAMLGYPGIDRNLLAADILGRLAEGIEAWRVGAGEAVAADYRRLSVTLGRQVRVQLPGDREITGMAIDIDANGGLIIDDGTSRQTVAAGDIVHLRPPS
ncbi:MAG: biotin--[acetyl-CoA-carboxylase] ligase [Mycolicibacterium insubricum]|nr:biotin--[acetyl-CoA-carboxylase] ligase [Mycobacterium sp.]